MNIDHFEQFWRSRRELVQVAARAILCPMAGAAFFPAKASCSNSNGRYGFALGNKGSNHMTPSVQKISDRLEIQELLVRYCYAVDDRDWATYRNIFTPDAVLDDTVTGGVRSGVEEHVAFMRRALSRILISQHAISTVLLDIQRDDARARVHCSCPMVVDQGKGRKQVFLQGLWYRDRLVRTPAGWCISELVEEGYRNHNIPEGFTF